MQLLKTAFSDTLHLFYPHVCNACGTDILQEDQLVCLKCLTELPHTNFAGYADNPIEKMFWGRMALTAAHAEFYFARESVIQRLIHQLKYKGKKDVGIYLGELMGRSLINSGRFSGIDYLLPLPLNARKEAKRGYNQAAVICAGMSTIMQVPVLKRVVERERFTVTQTKKHRLERWENVNGSFVVKDNRALNGKHVLLVDDVITTGATLEACGQAILQAGDAKLSIAALAFAEK